MSLHFNPRHPKKVLRVPPRASLLAPSPAGIRRDSLVSMAFQRIVTHPGGAHQDEFLACCVLLARHPVSIHRREPDETDLADPATAVVDVGGEHEPARGNFDHHQFPKDHPPLCALSLVLQHLGVYDDARIFCDWLETTERFDTRGPFDTAKWLGVSRDSLAKLISPSDITLLRRFAKSSVVMPGEILWELMRWVGSDLLDYLATQRQRLSFLTEHTEFWDIATGADQFRVLFLPRTDPLPDEPSAGLDRFIASHPEKPEVAGLVYPDRRGSGFGLSRHRDHPRLDFTRIDACDDVHFAHARGFVAKTSATDPQRLRELLGLAWTG